MQPNYIKNVVLVNYKENYLNYSCNHNSNKNINFKLILN